MKRAIIALASLVLVMVGAFLFIDSERKTQRTLVVQLAERTARQFLESRDNQSRYQMPTNVLQHERAVIDIDTIGRNWTVWIDVKNNGAVVVTISGKRGLPFLPLLNRQDDLIVRSVAYIPPDSRR